MAESKGSAQLDDLVGQIIGRLAHDLRNPLAVVLSNLRYLEGRLSDPDIREATDESVVSAERLSALIEDAAAIHILRQGHYQPSISKVHLADIGDLLARRLRLLLGSRKLTFDFPSTVVALDVKLFGRILEATLAHCIRHSPPGGRIQVSASSSDAQLAVRITDGGPPFGPGITPSFLDTHLHREPAPSGFRNDQGLSLHFAGLAARALGAKTTLDQRAEGHQGVVFQFVFPLDSTDQQ